MIDCHAHMIYYSPEDRERIINEMKNDGLKNIIIIGTKIVDSKWNIDFAQNAQNIFTTVGLYPEYSKKITQADLKELEKLAKSDKVVAIGEIGLDYHGEDFDKESQREIFVKQLEIADRCSLPFCIHCRTAVSDLYEILSQHKNLIRHGGLIHCYSEGKEWFKKFLDLGLYLSFSGNITYKKADRSFLKEIPLDKILVETDAPYLSPQPVRGTTNEPKNVKYVIDCIANELNIEPQEFEKITEQNARRFYYKIEEWESKNG